jgi:RimJ/RimL family protein N-acetyltransferase
LFESYKYDKVLADPTTTDFLMGAFKGNLLIGICGFTREKRAKTKHQGEISSMYVQPEFSGQKIGTGLLLATIGAAFEDPGLEQITLGVVEQNLAAQGLYQKAGFVEYGRLPHYFKHNDAYETQVLMVLTRNGIR